MGTGSIQRTADGECKWPATTCAAEDVERLEPAGAAVGKSGETVAVDTVWQSLKL